MYDFLEGVRYLHSKSVIHGNLRAVGHLLNISCSLLMLELEQCPHHIGWVSLCRGLWLVLFENQGH